MSSRRAQSDAQQAMSRPVRSRPRGGGREGGEALAEPPAGQVREGLGWFSSWAGKREGSKFLKENPFLFLVFKSKPNSNEI